MTNITDMKITIESGQYHTITLKSFASAGYIWNTEVDNLFIAAVERTQSTKPIIEPSVELSIGGSYDENFSIYGVGSGDTKVTFTQSRPFEFGPPHAEHIVYITVT